MMSILSLKLGMFKGNNINELVKSKPSFHSFFIVTKSKPGPINGVKSKYKVLMNVSKYAFTYSVCGRGCGCES